jgi:hypothetical protein
MNIGKIAIHCLLAIAVVMILASGCQPRVEEEPEVPPEIPPISTFVMDFDDFNAEGAAYFLPDSREMVALPGSLISGGGSLYPSGEYAIGQRANWGFAALNVGIWSVIIVVGLVIPVAAFVESFHHSPEQQPDYTWIWMYDVEIEGVIHTAELHGKYIDNGVRWDMYVSKQNEYTDFQWYYGESDLPATEGFWILKKSPDDPSDLLRIDWRRDLADGSHDLKYTNIVPNGPENGGYIFHGVTSGDDYDRFYEIYNKGKDHYTYIEWNYESKDGRVKDSNFFKDDYWHCWDGQYFNSECE